MLVLVLAWRVVAVITLAALILPFGWQSISRDYFMTVTGSSMFPTYAVGDVISVQPPTGHDLDRVGNIVVASKARGDKHRQYVHRVDTVLDHGAVLKGDNNSGPDPSPVDQSLVMGTPRFVLSGLAAHAFRFLQSWGGRGVLLALTLPAFIIPMRPRTRPAQGDRASQ